MRKIALFALFAAACCGPQTPSDKPYDNTEISQDSQDLPETSTTEKGLCANWNIGGTFTLTYVGETRNNCLAATPTLWSMFSPLTPMAIAATTSDTDAKNLAQSFRLIGLTGDTGCSAGLLTSSSCNATALGGCVLGGVPFMQARVTFNTTSIFTVVVDKQITPSASGSGVCRRVLTFQATRTGS